MGPLPSDKPHTDSDHRRPPGSAIHWATIAAGGLLLLASQLPARAGDVKWLREVTTAPRKLPQPRSGPLRPLLVDDSGRAVRTRKDWERRRRAIRAAWMKFLGPMPAKRPAVKLKVLRTDRLKGLVRQLVQYESEPGLTVEGYLLRPTDIKQGERRAGLVALHATTKNSIDQVAGVKGNQTRFLGLKLAQRGFVVFCPRCFLWQNAPTYAAAVERFKKRHPRTLGMHKMLYDALRGVDVLESLSYVDSGRIGAVGHSLGAKETLYLAAFDERIKAAVASEGGIGFQFTNWDAPWYLGKGIHAADFPLNHHQLLALIAPRPFLILAGEKGPGAADGDRSWPYVKAAQPIYRLYGKPVRLGLLNHRRGHSIPDAVFDRMADWLETYLGTRPAKSG